MLSKQKKHFFSVIFSAVSAAFLAIVLSACTPTIEVEALPNGNCNVSYSVILGKEFMNTVAAITNSSPTGVFFDTAEIENQLKQTGLSAVKATALAQNSLKVSVPVDMSKENIFTSAGILNKTTVTFSQETLPAIYAKLPDTARAYIDLFMAPVFTGDPMAKTEYTEFLASVFGEPLTKEVTSANLTLVLSAPHKKIRKRFTIPLVDLLTLNQTLTFELD